MQHSRIINPSKFEVRDWLNELLESKSSLPEPQEIRDQLWQHADRDRRGQLS